MTISATSSTNETAERPTLPEPNIAVIGGMGAGKTTAADMMCDYGGWQRVSFAAALKDTAYKIWGEGAQTDRDKLQKLGVAVREIDPDAWVTIALRNIDRENLYGKPVVIDDCRFPNEYWALKREGFLFLKIEVPEEIRVDRLMRNGKLDDLSQLQHESEDYWPGFRVDATLEIEENDIDHFEIGLISALDKLKRMT